MLLPSLTARRGRSRLSGGAPRVAIALAGCDFGTSGIGVYAKALLPRLVGALRVRGAAPLVIGTKRERLAFDMDDVEGVTLPSAVDRPSVSAAFSLLLLPIAAKALDTDLLYLPAANRRIVAFPLVAAAGTVHDLAQFHVRNKYGWIRQFYVKNVLVRLLKDLSLVTAVSQATAEDVSRYAGVPGSRIQVITNGVTLEEPDPAASLPSRPYLLYPARLEHPGKNHIRLIEAYARSSIRNTHDLLLAGEDWGALGRIRETIESLGLQGRVQPLGFLPRGQLMALLLGADAVVAAGLREGFGLQAAEALAAGIPVAASNTGSLPEVVGTLGVFFNPTQVGDIAEALGQVVTDQRLRCQCRSLGPVRARRFSWDRAANTLADALLGIAHGTS